MTRPLAVLRPEPGNAATAARIAALGLSVIRVPLFAVRALAWTAPDPGRHDALLLTSANAARLAGPPLDTLASLPVYAVGDATARAARDGGLTVRRIGQDDAAALLADARRDGVRQALHLGGRDTSVVTGAGVSVSIAVYASDMLPIDPAALAGVAGSVVLLHSARAASRLAELTPDRSATRLAALSATVAAAAGDGWDRVAIASEPTDHRLVESARMLAD